MLNLHDRSIFQGSIPCRLAEKQTMIGKTIPSNIAITPAVVSQTEGEYITHTVRSGDTIWDIVKQYE